ncbi:MAG: copper-binding protein [Burkholderiaceae bacterium]
MKPTSLSLYFFATALALAGSAAASGALARTQAEPAPHAEHHHTAMPEAAASAAPVARTEGEVRKLDIAQGKITLRHGPIVNLDMAGMTMVFRLADPRLAEGLKPGDRVAFSADNINGVLTVTAIEPRR